MVCGGCTFELYQDTGKVMDVGGFHPSMELLKSIKVGTLITAVDLDGKTIIAVFENHGSKQMSKSILGLWLEVHHQIEEMTIKMSCRGPATCGDNHCRNPRHLRVH